MKKQLITLSVLFVFVLQATAGCSNDGAAVRVTSGTTGVKDVIESAMSEQTFAGEIQMESSSETTEKTTPVSDTDPSDAEEIMQTFNEESIDVDLTELSPNMVYATVYDMMISPGRYIGKRVRMKGTMLSYHDETTDKYYFACFITDAAACCSQGIEFVLTDEYVFPDDYPEEDSEIIVEGVFETYTEDGATYVSLMDSRLG